MLDAMRHAVEVSKILELVNEDRRKEYTALNFKDALRLATVGSSKGKFIRVLWDDQTSPREQI